MEIELETGVKYKIDKFKNTATVIESPNLGKVGTLTIPYSVETEGKMYKVTSIGRHAFNDATIEYLNFAENSEVTIFEDDSLYRAEIKKLQIPASLKTLEGSWCRDLEVEEIELSPSNNNFQLINGCLLVGKSKESNKEFDLAYYLLPSTKSFTAPSSIKILKEFSFSNAKNLKSLIFPKDSQLEKIEEYAFYINRITKLVLPAKVKDIAHFNWNLPNLEDFEIAPENKYFKFVDNKYLCTKSDRSSEFDTIVFAPKCVDEVVIPSYIKKIEKNAFSYCHKICTFSLEPNSILETIGSYSFDDCNFQEKIVLPPSLKYVGMCAFAGTSGVNSVEFQSEKITLSRCCFNQSSAKQFSFPNAKVINLEDEGTLIGIEDAEFIIRKDTKMIGPGESKFTKNPSYIGEKSKDKEHRKSKDKKHHKKKEKSSTASNKKIELSEYQTIIQTLNQNSDSSSYKIKDTKNSMILYMKEINNNDEDFKEKISKEFENIKKIQHICLRKALDIKHEDQTGVALFYEFLNYKLKDCIENKILNDTLKVKIALEIASGLLFLHQNKIILTNLNIKNIMLNCIFEAKIINFGLSLFNETDVASLVYLSPEVQNQEKFDDKADVYSYGIILYYLFTGDLPKQTLKEKLNGAKIKFNSNSSSSSITKICKKLIKMCLSPDPKDRPSFDEIIDYMKTHSFELTDEVDLDIIDWRFPKLFSYAKP